MESYGLTEGRTQVPKISQFLKSLNFSKIKNFSKSGARGKKLKKKIVINVGLYYIVIIVAGRSAASNYNTVHGNNMQAKKIAPQDIRDMSLGDISNDDVHAIACKVRDWLSESAGNAGNEAVQIACERAVRPADDCVRQINILLAIISDMDDDHYGVAGRVYVRDGQPVVY